MTTVRWILAIILAICLLPVLAPLTASAVASMLGCNLNEGSAAPCRLAGIDIGGVLYAMFVAGWYGLVTVPAAIVTAVIWIAVEIGVYVMR